LVSEFSGFSHFVPGDTNFFPRPFWSFSVHRALITKVLALHFHLTLFDVLQFSGFVKNFHANKNFSPLIFRQKEFAAFERISGNWNTGNFFGSFFGPAKLFSAGQINLRGPSIGSIKVYMYNFETQYFVNYTEKHLISQLVF